MGYKKLKWEGQNAELRKKYEKLQERKFLQVMQMNLKPGRNGMSKNMRRKTNKKTKRENRHETMEYSRRNNNIRSRLLKRNKLRTKQKVLGRANKFKEKKI